jgi:hypothetical protein
MDQFKGIYHVWPTAIQIGALNIYPKGNLLKNLWQNNQYRAEGSVTLNTRRLSPDRLIAPKVSKFQIEFSDCINDIGLPNLKIVSISLDR